MRRLLYIWLFSLTVSAQSATYADRLVWVFGWNLNRDSDVTEISALLETAGKHRFNGAVVSFGLDTLCKKSPDFLRRLDIIKKACERNQIELIPAIFSVGYGGAAIAHDRNLAEGLLVDKAPFLVQGEEARFVPDANVKFINGDFEEYRQNRMSGFNFHDQPGEISFVDTEVKQSGKASLRLENFTANQHGHGRVMQEVRVQPRRCYRITLWAKTESLQPQNAFQISVLTGDRSVAPRDFKLPETGNWQKLSFVFNSLTNQMVRIYAGVWGGKKGKLWLDNWSIEEVGPLNVLHRPGTPVTVENASRSARYVEGKDYAPLVDPGYNPYRIDRSSPSLKILPGSNIKDGQTLHISWYHPMVIHDSQITVCMGEPALYGVFDHEAKLLAETVHPQRVLLNMDEVRMGGTCEACKKRNMAELLGECITRQTQILRRYLPQAEIAIWSDMLDPHHNAHGDYYLVEGDFTGSLKHVPKDLIIAVWGGKPRNQSLQYFSDNHFRTWVACYYDADNLDEVKEWIDASRKFSNVSGFMYTPWEKKYRLLPDFGDLLY